MSPQCSPTDHFFRRYVTSLPERATVAAVLIVAACLLVFIVFDVFSSRHLRAVIIAAFGQFASKSESVWTLASKQAVASTISSEIGGPASRCYARCFC